MAQLSYDVCVMGSGAAGGVMAKELCEGGAKVILLEAGQSVPPAKFRITNGTRNWTTGAVNIRFPG